MSFSRLVGVFLSLAPLGLCGSGLGFVVDEPIASARSPLRFHFRMFGKTEPGARSGAARQTLHADAGPRAETHAEFAIVIRQDRFHRVRFFARKVFGSGIRSAQHRSLQRDQRLCERDLFVQERRAFYVSFGDRRSQHAFPQNAAGLQRFGHGVLVGRFAKHVVMCVGFRFDGFSTLLVACDPNPKTRKTRNSIFRFSRSDRLSRPQTNSWRVMRVPSRTTKTTPKSKRNRRDGRRFEQVRAFGCVQSLFRTTFTVSMSFGDFSGAR